MANTDKKHVAMLKKVETCMSDGLTIQEMVKKLKIRIGKNHWDKNSVKYYTFCVNARKAILKREQTYSKSEIVLLKKIAKNSTSQQIMKELNKINPKRKWPGVKYYIHSILGIDRKHMIYRKQYLKYKKPKPSKDFSWFLGVMAGDAFTQRYYLRLRTVDKNFANKFYKIGDKLFGLKPRLSYEFPKSKNAKKVYQVEICSTLLVKYLGTWKKDNGNWINDLNTKFKWVSTNKGYLSSFLEGLFDSEGCVTCTKKYGNVIICITIAAKPYRAKKFIYDSIKKFNINCRMLPGHLQITGAKDCKKFAYLICSCIEKREKRLEQIRKIKISNNSQWHKYYKKVMKLKSDGYKNDEIYKKLRKFNIHEVTMRKWLLHNIKPKPVIILPKVIIND